MTTELKLNSIKETLVNQVLSGVTLKNVRRGLEFKNVPSEMIIKLMRIVQLEISLKGC